MTMSEQDGNSAVSEETQEDETIDTDNDQIVEEQADRDENDRAEQLSQLREQKLEAVRKADPADIADELAAKELTIEKQETQLSEKDDEIEDLRSRLKRKQADFQNYKKRIQKKRKEEQKRATESLVERLLDVRDNLKRALEQDDPADLRDGVESTFRQFEAELDRENVTSIEPEPGDSVDPTRHEVLARIESDRPDGVIAEVHRPGYEMSGKILRPAQVAVSNGFLTESEYESDTDGQSEQSQTSEDLGEE